MPNITAEDAMEILEILRLVKSKDNAGKISKLEAKMKNIIRFEENWNRKYC